MNSKIYSILLAVLLSFSMPLFSCSANSLSTVVRYESQGSDYYEITVPLEMAPGETASVYAIGNWDSSNALNIKADNVVTLVSEDTGDEVDLEIYFDGIFKYGDDSNEINVSKEIKIEDIDKSIRGTWEGTFNYSVSMEETEEHYNVIPEGGTYYVSATSNDRLGYVGDYSKAEEVYVAGDKFPDEVKIGDTYVYGDYEYRYQCGFEGAWYCDYTGYNWGVSVIDATKTSYQNILQSVNGKPVDNLTGAFWGTLNIVKAPVLPKSVKAMNYTFYYSSLAEPPVIPDSVEMMYRTFECCTNLKKPPVLPQRVYLIDYAFANCNNLENAPVIPENVTTMIEAFAGCTALSGVIEINATGLCEYDAVLYGSNITEIKGSISDELKSEILATKNGLGGLA